MQFNIKTGNYAVAGKAAADDAIKSFAAARRNSPDYGKIAQNAQTIRSAVKQEGIKAATDVTRAGIKATGAVKADKIVKTATRERDSAKRKAGALAVAGKMFGEAGTYLGDSGRKKRTIGSEDAWYDAQIKKARERQANLASILNGGTGASTGTGSGVTGSDTPGSSTNTPSPSGGGSSSGNTTPQSGGSTAMRLMSDLTNDGYTPVQAAAIVGNAQHESANFTAHEEFAPNAYGTRGAGFLQWTNAGGSSRRSNFENWSASQGLDPRSYEASSGFMRHELQGGAGNHWTGGMNDSSFRQITDLNTAVNAFQNNYLRPAPATANNSQRQSNAQAIYQQWMNQQ